MRTFEIVLLAVIGFVLLCCGLIMLAAIARSADLRPDTIDFEVAHTSHMSQHFGPNQTAYGYDVAGIAARWNYERASFVIFEGAIVERCYMADAYTPECGAMIGRNRELFQARIAYTLWSK